MKKIKRTISKLGYRTPNTFRRKIKHKIVKDKICGKISQQRVILSDSVESSAETRKNNK